MRVEVGTSWYEGHLVWSPGFSRSGVVSPLISKCFEPPSKDTPCRLKPGLHAPCQAHVYNRTVRLLIPAYNIRARGR
jgi:hypothetical protein